MQTRSAPTPNSAVNVSRKQEPGEPPRRKKPRLSAEPWTAADDCFNKLPDDVIISILCNLSSSASRPSDLVSVLLTCKRLNELGLNPLVLSMASPRSLAIRAKKWSDGAHRFFKRCSDAGNVEASYILGMIMFYCLESRDGGGSLMAKVGIGSHAAALYSLAIIKFNGSGGSKNDKDLRGGVLLCARSAFLGHVDALRELGHCLQDGYGVRKNVDRGRRFLLLANARELAAAASQSSMSSESGSLFSDFGCNVPTLETHPANRFLIEWFGLRGTAGPELRLCSHAACGRPETRKHEFRRCSVCGDVNYCSRACQALHWKLEHKNECAPPNQEEEMQDAAAADAGAAMAGDEGGDGNEEEEEEPAPGVTVDDS